jgi:hypothetical protein
VVVVLVVVLVLVDVLVLVVPLFATLPAIPINCSNCFDICHNCCDTGSCPMGFEGIIVFMY